MSYNYATERPQVFTEEGVKTLTKIRDKVRRLLNESGAIRFQEAVSGISGDSWLHLAVFDYLVEKGELREVPNPISSAGQHRLFVGPR